MDFSDKEKALKEKEKALNDEEKDLELFFGEEYALKRKEEEIKKRGEELVKNWQVMRQKEDNLIERERKIIEKEEYLREKGTAMDDLEKSLNARKDLIEKQALEFEKLVEETGDKERALNEKEKILCEEEDRMKVVQTNLEDVTKKEAELRNLESDLSQREKLVSEKESSLKNLEASVNSRKEEVDKKEAEVDKLSKEVNAGKEEVEKARTELEILKKDLETREKFVKKGEELKAGEEKLESKTEEVQIRETKVNRLGDELDKKRKALQIAEEDLVERKIKIEEEERKLKIMKGGLEEKAKDFEYLFKEDEEKIRAKIEELERFLGTAHKPKIEAVQSTAPIAEPSRPVEDTLERPVPDESPPEPERPEEPPPVIEEPAPESPTEKAYEPSVHLRSAEEVLEDNKSNEEATVRKFTEERASKPADENFAKGMPLMKEVPKGMESEASKAATEEEDFRSKEMALMEAAGKKGGSEKDQDDLLKLMQKDKRINLKTASKILNVPDETVTQWANDLKGRGILNVHPKFMGGTELELTKDAMRRLKELEEEDKVSKIKKELERIREEQRKMKGG